MSVSQELRDFIVELAEKSAAVILPYWNNPELEIELKENQTPVTLADKKAEEVMREMITKRFPDHGIIGEEYGTERGDAEYVWTLDPIDGTISFSAGCPLYGTLIALLRNGRPVLGVIHQPNLRQLVLGDGVQTTLNGRVIKMREINSISEATLLCTDSKHIELHRSKEGFEQVYRATRMFRTWGDCYGYILLATGGGDIMLDAKMNIWDIMPLIPVIEGAGGVITGWNGEEAYLAESSVAAHPNIHAEVLRLVQNR